MHGNVEGFWLATWNLKAIHLLNGWFNWMVQILYIVNGCVTKHSFQTGCLEFQECTSKFNVIFVWLEAVVRVFVDGDG